MNAIKVLLIFLIIFLIGTFGYMIIEGWTAFDSFYMTGISITTVGFGETRPLSPSGKVFTIALIFTGLGAAAVFAAQFSKTFLESHFKTIFGAKNMLKKINKLKNHYVICGFGGVGSAICATLSDSNINFVVIEENEDTAKWAEKRGYFTVVGKATYDQTLIQAGVKQAKGVVISIGDDALNMYVSLAARELNPEIFIIDRGYKSDIENRLIRAGANTVVYPIKMGGEQIAHLIKKQINKNEGQNEVEALSGSVLGYSLRTYRHYNSDEITVGDVKKRMYSPNVITLKRVNGDEIINPDDNVTVHRDDNLLLVTESSRKDIEVKKSSIFYWKDEYNLDFPIIDEQHRKLFQLCDDFVNSVKKGSDREVLSRSYNNLIEYTLEHFEHEENLFKQYNFTGKESHIKKHHELSQRLIDLNKNRNYLFSINIEDFLFDWLKEHILNEDRSFVEYVQSEFNA